MGIGDSGGAAPKIARRAALRWFAPAALLLMLSPFALTGAAKAADSSTPPDLSQLSIEDLSKVDISSVTKSSEALSDAPAAIYVISHDDIIRSGARTIPEILRLAPNLEVAQINASQYAISARGFNGQLADKLLVLIDGRIVYSPLYAGVYWDLQYVLPEDIERIEVISGPGATLWGANAVNGVINIITRKSSDTQGGMVEAGVGNYERRGSTQYGGALSSDLTYRAYAEDAAHDSFRTSVGTSGDDAWTMPQGGFRMDWNPPGDLVTAQGDTYHMSESQSGAANFSMSGQDVLGRWQHDLGGGSSLQLLSYFDQSRRFTQGAGGGFSLDTYDIEVQHSFNLGGWNDIVWGAGDRIDSYNIVGVPVFYFAPTSRTLNLSDIFAQDTVSLLDSLKLILGTKLEHEPYTGYALLPSGRISWKPIDNVLVWSAVSRAVRAPTPFDRDAQLGGSPPILVGGEDFQPEKLTAYELGTRIQPLPELSFSISTFYNDYDQLRSVEYSPVTLLPLYWGNMMYGNSYGVETWGTYRVTDWWRLSAGLNVQHENFKFRSGSAMITGSLASPGDDPNHQASLRSSMNLPDGFTLDVDLRNVGKLHAPYVPSYFELNGRVGWQVTKSVELSLSAMNLLHSEHVEFVASPTVEIPRSFFVDVKWRF
jgi:iron complex outermembrane receptor protein